MNSGEKTAARFLFQNKILKADGQAFEDIFTAIMNYAEMDFQSIKPWGNIGDRKNDGYIKSKGVFYQVYAPEDIRMSYADTVKKLKNDFDGLTSHWRPVNEFYFVVNDKYKGVNADCEQTIQEIKKKYNLAKAGFLTAKDVENILFRLDDDQICMMTGHLPDPAAIKQLDWSILKEVIGHIMLLNLETASTPDIILPDWEEKIRFNTLSERVARYLDNGYLHVCSIDDYLSSQGDFLADSLRDKMNEIYLNRPRDPLFANLG